MNMQEVLTANSLEQYKDAFSAAGLTTFDYFLSLSPDEVDQILINLGMLRGHTFKFKMMIDEMKSKAVPKSVVLFPVATAGVNSSTVEDQTASADNTLKPQIDITHISKGSLNDPHISEAPTVLNSLKSTHGSNTSESSTNSNICHQNNGNYSEITNEISSKVDHNIENSVAACTLVQRNVSVRETAIKVVMLKGQLDFIVQFKETIVQALTQFTDFDFSNYIQSLKDLRTMQESINGLLSVDNGMSS